MPTAATPQTRASTNLGVLSTKSVLERNEFAPRRRRGRFCGVWGTCQVPETPQFDHHTVRRPTTRSQSQRARHRDDWTHGIVRRAGNLLAPLTNNCGDRGASGSHASASYELEIPGQPL